MYYHRNFATKETRIFKLDCVKNAEKQKKKQITELSVDKWVLKICGSKGTALGKQTTTNNLAARKIGTEFQRPIYSGFTDLKIQNLPSSITRARLQV